MKKKKIELSDRLLSIVLRELPIENMTQGNPENAKEYIDILTDSMSAVMARMVVAYMGCLSSYPGSTEEDVAQVNEWVHERLSQHLTFEAANLAEQISKKESADARNWD